MGENFAYGVDLGWVGQLEKEGYAWVDDAGGRIDPIKACKDMGANAVRLRIFVNPPADAYWMKNGCERVMLGYCDADSVLAVASRAKALGMDIMLDFHYSDHFADPMVQDIPEAWTDDDEDALTQKVYAHTRDTLQKFLENDIHPRWIQVGNEINNGLMWPKGSLGEHPAALVRYLNAGYDAVKDILPDCQVVTHMAMMSREAACTAFLDNFFARGGKTDILGFSYYPYWEKFESDSEVLAGWLSMYEKKYNRPVMIVEVGAEDEREDVGYGIVRDCIKALRSLSAGLGVFYWEPDAHRSLLPDGYPLGASVPAGEGKLRFTKALSAYLI